MSYDDKLAARVDKWAAKRRKIERKEMFGGLCYLIGGNMIGGVRDANLILRLGPAGDVHLGKPNILSFPTWRSSRPAPRPTRSSRSGSTRPIGSPLRCHRRPRNRRRNRARPLHERVARTVRTGTGQVRTTVSATLPSSAREMPRRPCVPITTRSAWTSSAA